LETRILVVEDDPEISDLVALHLRRAGYTVDTARDGHAALAALDREPPDLVLLDLMLPPGPDGLALCRRIRERARYLPVLILTARGDEVDRVVGLELGADDYVTKPFSVRELVARVRSLLRRHRASAPAEGDEERPLRFGALRIDRVRREVRLGERAVELTAREFDLLVHFARHPGRVFTRASLLDDVWGYAHRGYEHTVNSHINRLRAKIEEDPARPRWVLTVWGVGYKFGGERASASGAEAGA